MKLKNNNGNNKSLPLLMNEVDLKRLTNGVETKSASMCTPQLSDDVDELQKHSTIHNKSLPISQQHMNKLLASGGGKRRRRKRRRMEMMKGKNNESLWNNEINGSRRKRRRRQGAAAACYKLPILTRVELVSSVPPSSKQQQTVFGANNNDESVTTSLPSSSLLFSDYLLVSSRTKFKYLLASLFEQIQLEDKQNLVIVDGNYRSLLFIFYVYLLADFKSI